MSLDLNEVTSNVSMTESTTDVIESGSNMLTCASANNVNPNVITYNQTTITHGTDSVFDKSEHSITSHSQMSRKRSKSLSYESIGIHQTLPSLHGERINVTYSKTNVGVASNNVSLRSF